MNDPKHAVLSLAPPDDNAQIHALLDKLPAAAYLCDNGGLITYFNARAVELWGRAPALRSPEDRYCGSFRLFSVDGTPIPHDACWMARALREQRDQVGCEIVIERPDGSRRRALAHVMPLSDRRQRLAGAINILVDVTIPTQNEERLALLLESIDDHFVQYDHEWRYTFVTRKGAAMVGKRPEDLLGRSIWELFPEAVGNLYYQKLHEVAAGRKVARFEHFYAPFDRWYANYVYPTASGITVFSTDITQQKVSEQALQRAERKHQALMELLPIGVAWYDGSGRLQYYNRRAAAIWGIGDADAARTDGSPPRRYGADGAPLPAAESPVAATLRTGGPTHCQEFLVERPDGSRITIMSDVDPVHDETGLLTGAVDVFQDITERRLAEETRSRLAAIVESSHDAIIGKTLTGIVTSWNGGAEKLFGYPASEMIGSSIERIYPPDRISDEARLLARVQAGARVENLEAERMHRDGHRLNVSITVSPVRSGDGRIIGASTVARDIGARLAIERALKRRVAEQSALYEFTDRLQRASSIQEVCDGAFAAIAGALGCSRASILLQDEAGVMRFIGWRGLSDDYRRAVEGHSPWTRGDRDPRSICIPDVRTAGFSAELDAVIRREGIAALAFVPLIADSQLIGKFMLYYESPHPFEEHEVALALTIARQLSFGIQRRRDEQALREADRRKDEFLATLSHELRNPLAPIRNAVEILKRGADHPDLQVLARDTIERQSAQLVRLVDDLLDVSRISRNKLDLRRERLDLNAVLLGAVETSGPLIADAGHQLEIRLSPEPVHVDGDPVRLTQIFSNLLNNAAKYTERGGRITLEVVPHDGNVQVVVRDTGIGISPDVLPHIFEMFVQEDRSIERAHGGLGIGLTLVERLVAMHGGEVRARSAGRGHGSEFTVRLPTLATPVIRVAPGGPVTLPAERSRRILVADDNRDSADSLADALSLLGHQVRVAYDGRAAVEAATSFAPDLVLLDLGMPELSGYDAAREIRANLGSRKAAIVAVTGWGQEEDRRRTATAGFDLHLVKPIDFEALRGVVSSL